MIKKLIEALYIPETELPSNEFFYTQIIEEIDFKSIAPQIYYLIKTHEKIGDLPDFFYQYLKREYLQTLQLNVFVKQQTTQILKAFELNGIDAIPLKGVYFAEVYFGNLGARRTSDIDLLIKEQDIDKASHIVKQLGFTTEEEKIPEHFHFSYSKRLPSSEIPLVVEIHWGLLKESTSNFEIEDFWEAATLHEHSNFIRDLSMFHTFYMIILHGWRHNLDSLKYYLDIIQLILFFKDEIDFEILMTIAEKHQTKKRIIRTLSSVYQEFPFLDGIKPFPYKSGRKYLELENKKGSTSLYKKYSDYLNYQYGSYDNLGHTLKEIVSAVLLAKKL